MKTLPATDSWRPLGLAFGLALGLALAGCAAHAAAPALSDARASAARAARVAFEHGTALLQRGDMLRAEQYLVLAARRGYPEAEVLPALVRSCVASSRLRAALDHALPYLRLHPDAWRLRYLVAAIQLALGRADLALSELRAIVRAKPQAAGPNYLAGVIERDRHDEPAASARFAAYLNARPHGAHAAEVSAWLDQRAQPEPEPDQQAGAP